MEPEKQCMGVPGKVVENIERLIGVRGSYAEIAWFTDLSWQSPNKENL